MSTVVVGIGGGGERWGSCDEGRLGGKEQGYSIQEKYNYGCKDVRTLFEKKGKKKTHTKDSAHKILRNPVPYIETHLLKLSKPRQLSNGRRR